MKDNNKELMDIHSCGYENKTAITVTDEEEVYPLPKEKSRRSLIPSILSLILGFLSVLLFGIWWLGTAFALISLGLAIFSRIKMGYFNKIAIIGLITSIVGAVFGVCSAVITISGVFNSLI